MLEGLREATVADCEIGDIVGIRGGDRLSLAIVGAQIDDSFELITLHSLSDFLPEPFVIIEFRRNDTVLKICSDYRFIPSIEPLGDQFLLGYRPDVGDLVFDRTGLCIAGKTSGHISGLRQFSPVSGKSSHVSGGAARLRSWKIISNSEVEVELFVRE